MARIRIELPEKFLFETEMDVRVYDLNYGAHLGNDRVLAILHEARVRFFRFLGIDNEKDGLDGKGVIMTDAAVVYKSESFLGDSLRIKVAVSDVSTKAIDVLYLVLNCKTGKEVARGKTGILCFDYEKRKIADLPEHLIKKMMELQEM